MASRTTTVQPTQISWATIDANCSLVRSASTSSKTEPTCNSSWMCRCKVLHCWPCCRRCLPMALWGREFCLLMCVTASREQCFFNTQTFPVCFEWMQASPSALTITTMPCVPCGSWQSSSHFCGYLYGIVSLRTTQQPTFISMTIKQGKTVLGIHASSAPPSQETSACPRALNFCTTPWRPLWNRTGTSDAGSSQLNDSLTTTVEPTLISRLGYSFLKLCELTSLTPRPGPRPSSHWLGRSPMEPWTPLWSL
mmetsp:Transcript_118810/g.314126  ORF Transcript_118810/g.314126 Transcript_118810/m.314126 type:complete len:252 (-) Transcript_118810:42-797(-)